MNTHSQTGFKLRRVVTTQEGRPYLFLRILSYLVLFLAVLIVTEVLMSALVGVAPPLLIALVGFTVKVGGIFGLTYVWRRKVDRRDWRGMALSARRSRAGGRFGLTGLGFLLGALVLSGVVLIQYLLGWLEPLSIDLSTVWVSVLVGLIAALATGLAEELAFRGYLFQNLGERVPIWAAVLLSGLIFGGLHFLNGGFSALFVLTALIGSLAFIVMRLATGSLWLGIGFHAAWDWVQFDVLGVAAVNQPGGGEAVVRFQQNGPPLWVGVAPSIEGGLLFMVVLLVIATVLLLRLRGKKVLQARLTPEGELTTS